MVLVSATWLGWGQSAGGTKQLFSVRTVCACSMQVHTNGYRLQHLYALAMHVTCCTLPLCLLHLLQVLLNRIAAHPVLREATLYLLHLLSSPCHRPLILSWPEAPALSCLLFCCTPSAEGGSSALHHPSQPLDAVLDSKMCALPVVLCVRCSSTASLHTQR